MLTWRTLGASAWRMVRLSGHITLHRKLYFMYGGAVVYYGLLYAFAIFRPGEGFSVEQALHVLVEVPGAVLAIYLAMDMVSGERNKDTLEILFSTSASHYGIWLVRLLSVCGVLFASLLGMSLLAYLLFAEFPFVRGGLHACLSAFVFVAITFYFSVLCKSGNAAGMVAMGVLILILMGGEALQNSPYLLFVNPFNSPMGMDALLWRERVILNRVGWGMIGMLFVFLALKRMENREKLF